MSADEVDEVKNEESPEIASNEVNEEAPEITSNEVNEEATEIAPENKIEEKANKENEETKPKANPKKLARSVKVVELAECEHCLKKMTPKSLKHTHPNYCKGQPTETLPVNKQKASYGSKVEQKLRKEIEAEMKAKYEAKNEVVNYSEPIEVKTKASVPSVPQRPVRMEHEVSCSMREHPPPPKQLSTTELLQQHYNEIRKAKQQEKIEKINRFKSSMF